MRQHSADIQNTLFHCCFFCLTPPEARLLHSSRAGEPMAGVQDPTGEHIDVVLIGSWLDLVGRLNM